MNRSDISGEKIIETSIELIRREEGGLNMRRVAAACGVAVGSLYNYFPTKEDLGLAVIKRVWETAFSTKLLSFDPKDSFTDYLSRLYTVAYECNREYHGFFLRHRMLMSAGSEAAKKSMGRCIGEIVGAISKALSKDKAVSPKAWLGGLNPDSLAGFVFSNLMLALSSGKENCDFLILILSKILYQE